MAGGVVVEVELLNAVRSGCDVLTWEMIEGCLRQ